MKRRGLLKLFLLQAIATIHTKQAWASIWSYTGKTGAGFWGELHSEFQACSLGQAQSPIDLESSVDSNFDSLQLDYQDTPLIVINNGRTIKVDYQPGSGLTIDGKIYELLQFHFHQPSEHLISGKAYNMQVHFVHQNKNTGDLLVLAVLMSQGKFNRDIDRILRKVSVNNDSLFPGSDFAINALNLLPENIEQYYRYQGSLTTPPCLENVTWLVLKQPVEISKLQRDRFFKIIGNNARPIQALNQRKILSNQ